MDALPRIISVQPLPADWFLRVTWVDGRVTDIDMTGAVHRVAAFAPLRDLARFRTIHVIDNGFAVAWEGDDLDYAAHSLDFLAHEQEPFGSKDFTAWQDALRLSNQEAADFLDVSLGTVKNYRAGGAIPKPVRMACRATIRDPQVLQAHFHPRFAGRPRTKPASGDSRHASRS